MESARSLSILETKQMLYGKWAKVEGHYQNQIMIEALLKEKMKNEDEQE